MRLLRFIEWWGLRDRAMNLMSRQAVTIMELRWRREQDQLTYARNLRDLLTGFRQALDQEDYERIRDILDAAIVDMADQVARTEEHLVQ